MRQLVVCVLVSMIAGTGCSVVKWAEKSDIRGSFVTAESCPADRVTVKRSHVRPPWLVPAPPPAPPPPPPPEIAADPERAAIYASTHPTTAPDEYADYTFFLAQGCDRSRFYMCDLEPNGDGSVSPVCTPAPAPPTSAPGAAGAASTGITPAADVATFLAFFSKLVDGMVADAGNCPKMAADMNALMDANKDVLELVKRTAAAGTTSSQAAKDQMTPMIVRMTPAMQACAADVEVQTAFQRLDVH